MCGIVGYVGSQQAAPILLDGLSKLEYRGYDSAGLAVRNGTEETEVIKAKGRLKVLFEKTNGGAAVPGTCGIGHTRWATHGEPSENNAHPHMSDDGNVVAVHNGIIENYQELKNKLLRKGYTFYSETDTEVAVKLIDYYYKKYEGTPVDAINHSLVRIRGSYALAVMFKDYPEEIYVARKDSPMILGVGDGESFIASDVPAILKYTRNVYYIGNLEMAKVSKEEITFYNLDGEEIQKKMKTVDWDAEAAEKAHEEHEHEHHHHHDGEECCCGHHHDEDEHDHHHDHDEDEHEHHHHGHDEECGCGHDHHHEGHHHADDVFSSWGTETPNKYDKATLEGILKKLAETEEYGKILRSKGMLPCTDGTWMYFDLVPGEYEIRDGKADFTGRICVIGAELKEDALKTLFEIA